MAFEFKILKNMPEYNSYGQYYYVDEGTEPSAGNSTSSGGDVFGDVVNIIFDIEVTVIMNNITFYFEKTKLQNSLN